MGRERADVHLDVTAGGPAESRASGAEPRLEDGRAIAIVGDLSGWDGRAPEADNIPLAERRLIPLDRDTLDAVLAELAPRAVVDLGVAGAAPFELRFRSLDDFHPDRLLDRVPLLAMLDGRALELRAEPGPAETAAPQRGLLDRILDATPDVRTAPGASADDLAAFVARIVARHVVPERGPEERAADERLAELRTRIMRAVLRSGGVRRLEAVWRALDVLVRRVDTGADLRLYGLDVSRTELATDLAANPRMEESAFAQAMARATTQLPPGTRWDMLVGLYTFRPEGTDLALVRRLASVGRRAGAGWLAGAEPWGGQWPDPDEPGAWDWTASADWVGARRDPDAGWVGLALPGFLLRAPYGAGAEPCDRFSFEELADAGDTGAYVWGHPAVACAAAILEGGARRGPVELDGLPVHVIRDASGSVFQGCVEAEFTEEQADRLLDAGLIPLVSPRGTDRLLVHGLRAIAEPAGPLPGWGRP